MEFMGYDAYGNTDIILGITAVTISVALFLYPIPTMLWILRGKSSDTVQPYPYVATQVASLLWLLYSLPGKTAVAIPGFHVYCLTVTSLTGFVLELAYTYTFIYYTKKMARGYVELCLIGQFMCIVFIPSMRASWFAAITGPGKNNILGPAATIFGIVMYTSPLPFIVDAWRNKRADYWVFGFCMLLCLNAATWFTYGFSYAPTYDVYVAVANGCGLILGIFQLVLSIIPLVIYQNSGVTEDPRSDLENPLLHGTC